MALMLVVALSMWHLWLSMWDGCNTTEDGGHAACAILYMQTRRRPTACAKCDDGIICKIERDHV